MFARALRQKQLEPNGSDRLVDDVDLGNRSVVAEETLATTGEGAGQQNPTNAHSNLTHPEKFGRLVHLTAASLICDSSLNPIQCGRQLAGQLKELNDCVGQRLDLAKRRKQLAATHGGCLSEPMLPALYEDIPSEYEEDSEAYATLGKHRHQSKRGGELVRLEWPIESQDPSLTSPEIAQLQSDAIGSGRQLRSPNYMVAGQCTCPLMSLDALRRIKLASLQQADLQAETTADDDDDSTALYHLRPLLLPSSASQLRESGCKLTRSKLIKRLDLRRKLRQNASRLRRQLEANTEAAAESKDEFDRAQQAGAFSASFWLYELEHLIDEANTALVANLSQFARHDLNRLDSILDKMRTLEDPNESVRGRDDYENNYAACSRLPVHGLPIGARLADARPYVAVTMSCSGARADSHSDLDSDSPQAGSFELNSSDDSGIVSSIVSTRATVGSFKEALKTTQGRGKRRRQNDKNRRVADRLRICLVLEEHLRYRSSRQFKQIVTYSCKLFRDLLTSSPLLKFELMSGEAGASDSDGGTGRLSSMPSRLPDGDGSTLHRLKLFARVECQKLRAILRFDWLAKCLWFAFEGNYVRDDYKEDCHQKKGTSDWRLPSILAVDSGNKLVLDEQVESDYLDSLALLMGHLLRVHFLEFALDLWIGSIKRLLNGATGQPYCQPPNLSVQVDLVEQADAASGTSRLHTSRPSQLVKEALEFVIDELASTCCHLPRLECQLESSLPDEAIDHARGRRHIRVLQSDDNLLCNKKQQLRRLIDRAGPTSKVTPSASEEDNWICLEHVQVVDILNKFRCNDDLERLAELASDSVSTDESEQFESSSSSSRGAQMAATCGQVKLLNKLEYKLCCQLERHFNFGALIRLDLAPLIEKLAKIIHKERLLLIRVHSDDLFKLMESLRLQLDELELNIDLESALEDYSNKRWQIKQSQQPDLGRALLLDDNEDNGNDGNSNNYSLAMFGAGLSDQQPQQRVGAENSEEVAIAPDFKLDEAKLTESELIETKARGRASSGVTHNSYRETAATADDGQEEQENASIKEEEDEDDFVNALVSNSNPNVAHLFTLSNPNGIPLGELMSSGELGVGGRGIAPLIECRLLLACYQYLASFLHNELHQFSADKRFVLTSGLVFLTEYLPATSSSLSSSLSLKFNQYTKTQEWQIKQQHLIETSQLELIGELAIRSREFSQMLTDSLQRLNQARSKLRQSTQIRSNVLNRICIEFDWLMQQLSSKRLLSNSSTTTTLHDVGGAGEPTTTTEAANQVRAQENIKRLDLIQDTASWARKLAQRLDFLECQNDLLRREAKLLFSCDQYRCMDSLISQLARDGNNHVLDTKSLECLASAKLDQVSDMDLMDSDASAPKLKEFELRSAILSKWRQFIELASKFWLLVHEFETQQVKWLNSDAKKLDYEQIELIFSTCYADKLEVLTEELNTMIADFGDKCNDDQVQGADSDCRDKLLVLRNNFQDAKRNFDHFAQQLLPIFKFLTNKHLSPEHWVKLNQLTQSKTQAPPLVSLRQQQRLQQQQQLVMVQDGGGQQFYYRVYTTVAQLLELGVQQFVGELEIMSHQATIEHEISSLMEAETNLNSVAGGHMSVKRQLQSLEVCSRLDDWTDQELTLAASRFIKLKTCSNEAAAAAAPEQTPSSSSSQQLVPVQAEPLLRSPQIDRLAHQLVSCHSTVKRYLKLCANLNLITTTRAKAKASESSSGGVTTPPVVVVRSERLRAGKQVRASLLAEYLRLFTQIWLESSAKLAARLARVRSSLDSTRAHLDGIGELLDQVRHLNEIDLQQASRDSEQNLSKLQQECIQLELQREILATKEALALDRQRDALKLSDTCIRQLSERAIPAIRAASKALDCLGDGLSLRALRSYRSRPPLAIRLVIEAVCLLRNASYLNVAQNKSASNGKNIGSDSHEALFVQAPALLSSPQSGLQMDKGATSRRSTPGGSISGNGYYSTSPERRFDPIRGQIMEDYWPIAWRTLNGLHSSKFIHDLRQLNRRTIPREIIYLIRRKYLSRAEFNVNSIERVSHETSLLARWVIAVDVFDRVMNIVKPSYEQYVKSEASCSQLSADVAKQRQQINAIGRQLEQLNELIQRQVQRRATLVDLIDDCAVKSSRLAATRVELELRRQELEKAEAKLEGSMRKLARKCLWQATQLVYLRALPADESGPIERILRNSIRSIPGADQSAN